MSAQVIAALRKRADALGVTASQAKHEGKRETALLMFTLAAEFRALADEAEGLERGAPEGEQDEWPP